MDKKLLWKTILIIIFVIVAVWTLYPPNKTLKPGIDLAGGVSLTYEINDEALSEVQKQNLSQRMINVLRRRIDPTNVQNLVWRPQGSKRFEVQMPLASKEARTKRQIYENALTDILNQNINTTGIMRTLRDPNEQRELQFRQFANNDPNRLEILQDLAQKFDLRENLRQKRDAFSEQLRNKQEKLTTAKLNVSQIKQNINDWMKLTESNRSEKIKDFIGNDPNLPLLEDYVKTYADWADAVEKLTNPDTGLNTLYQKAQRQIDKLNLSEEQIKSALEKKPGTPKRQEAIQNLKKQFLGKAEKIDKIIAADDAYKQYGGRLDDPKDLQRMLKGAGVLEFRILPTLNYPDIDSDEIQRYIDTLKTKGPKYASDENYLWCQIEDVKQWIVQDSQGNQRTTVQDEQHRPAVVAPFGDKFYVLASSNKDEAILHKNKGDWTLENSQPTTDRMGRNAIAFQLDAKGGKLFLNVTGKNIGRPLCILLDDIAISAPVIQSQISTNGTITGQFARTEVLDMVNKLNAGSLPAMLIEQPISVKAIGPSIGADNRDKGIEAGLIGLAAVIITMLTYYLLAGSIADVALILNILFVLAIMALLRATFTLPGIAGIILTIGMSVDANVLIFERIREEQQKGSSLRIAIRNGYQKAFRTIFDANLTTFITAAILFWVASEEIKGFAIVLMLGIISSMFTALFVTRVFFDHLLAAKLIKDHLVMLRLIHRPKINWMKARPAFLTISALLIAGGLTVFFTRDNTKNNKYDIEFTGGTSAQINLKEGVNLTRQQVQNRIRKTGNQLSNPALATANVHSIGKTNSVYEITTTETNKTTASVTLDENTNYSPNVDTVKAAIRKAQEKVSGTLPNLQVIQDEQNPKSFIITTSQIIPARVKNILGVAFPKAKVSEPKVQEVVNNAIKQAFSNELETQQNLKPEIVSAQKIDPNLIDRFPELTNDIGGVEIICKIQNPVPVQNIDRRIKDLRFKPDAQNLTQYQYQLRNEDLSAVTDPNKPVYSFAYISTHPEAGLRELSQQEWNQFVDNETKRLIAATTFETSLSRVTQIDPSVGAEAKTRALIAIILSLFAIVGYIWIRFGDVRFGFAAIIALVHDVCITLGAVTACTYIASTNIGHALLIGDFKIDLAMIAAFLTLIGYSLNDTIVVFDRIRENRKKKQLNPQIITDSINQTISRTILTSFTTFLVVLVMYIFGGQGLRGFTFAIGLGVIIGTYSSIAIAAPILLIGQKLQNKNDK